MLARLARDLPGWLRRPVTLDAARGRIRQGLAMREARVLALADKAIYRHRRSPYRALLANAGCEPGDLRRLVADEGLEGALTILSEQGVYATVDEMKGRRPIVRGSFTLRPRSAQLGRPRGGDGDGGRPIAGGSDVRAAGSERSG